MKQYWKIENGKKFLKKTEIVHLKVFEEDTYQKILCEYEQYVKDPAVIRCIKYQPLIRIWIKELKIYDP